MPHVLNAMRVKRKMRQVEHKIEMQNKLREMMGLDEASVNGNGVDLPPPVIDPTQQEDPLKALMKTPRPEEERLARANTNGNLGALDA